MYLVNGFGLQKLQREAVPANSGAATSILKTLVALCSNSVPWVNQSDHAVNQSDHTVNHSDHAVISRITR